MRVQAGFCQAGHFKEGKPRCKICRAANQKRWNHKNKEKVRAMKLRYLSRLAEREAKKANEPLIVTLNPQGLSLPSGAGRNV